MHDKLFDLLLWKKQRTSFHIKITLSTEAKSLYTLKMSQQKYSNYNMGDTKCHTFLSPLHSLSSVHGRSPLKHLHLPEQHFSGLQPHLINSRMSVDASIPLFWQCVTGNQRLVLHNPAMNVAHNRREQPKLVESFPDLSHLSVCKVV